MTLVNAILPLFAVILVGFTAVRSRYVAAETLRPVGEVVLRIALPALIFLAVAGAAPGDGLRPAVLAAIAAGSLASFGTGLIAGRWLLRLPRPQAALIALGISASNSGFIGYPVVQQLYGTAEAGRLLAHMMVVENLLIIPLALVLSTPAQVGGGLRLLARDLARNPLILSLAAALAVRLLGLALPEQLTRTLDFLARMSAPAALLVVGGALAALRPERQSASVAMLVLGKLVLHPLFTLAALVAVPGLTQDFVTGAVLFAAMPMMSIYPLLCQRAGLQSLAAAALMAATVAAAASIALWVWVLALL